MLKTIIDQKKVELERRREVVSLRDLEKNTGGSGGDVPSFSAALSQPGVSIIAEIKYKSPSHGFFACQRTPEEISGSYSRAGAAALSVLTDQVFFAGSLEYLARVRKHLDQGVAGRPVPLLRKDFILDRYQILEAGNAGASALLLIAAVLPGPRLKELLEATGENGMEALVEVHDPRELEAALESGAGIIGVNNRNLKNFKVDIRTSFDIARRLEGVEGLLLVSESGISEPLQIQELAAAGFEGFLIGSAFMDSEDPGEALAGLLDRVGRPSSRA